MCIHMQAGRRALELAKDDATFEALKAGGATMSDLTVEVTCMYHVGILACVGYTTVHIYVERERDRERESAPVRERKRLT